jgi:hypothetical protein
MSRLLPFLCVGLLALTGGATVPRQLVADVNDLHDITDIEPAAPAAPGFPWSARVVTRLGIGVLLLAAVGALGWTYLRRGNRRPRPPRPDEWALRELERLEGQGLPAAGAFERYHTMLSDLLRHYLELRFGFPAPEQTTAEILQRLPQTGQLPENQAKVLREVLERCDLAKFAGIGGTKEDCLTLADRIRQFIRATAGSTVATGPPLVSTESVGSASPSVQE